MISSEQINIIKRVTSQSNPSYLGVFGSYARDEETEESDLDLLVDFKASIHLLDLIGLEQELTNALGVRVDLVTFRSLHPSIRPFIEADVIQIA
jgi:predicted nucleotidyltransferase